MVIVLVGLIGIAAMVPFAGRQAADSYRMTQALALGESALNTLTQTVIQPRMDGPWQVVDDFYRPTDSSNSIAISWSNIYRDYLYANGFTALTASGMTAPYDSPTNRDLLARLQNQVLGTGFCIDPLFWGYQERGARIMQGARGNYRRTRFPFYNEAMPSTLDPITPFGVGGIITPRLLRVTQADPLGGNNGGWLRLASAQQLSTISGGDLTPANPEIDRSAAPLRGEYVDGTGALLQSPTNAAAVSWMATMTPSDGTPLVTADSLTYLSPTLVPNIEFFPERYDLAVVVFGKRDARELLNPLSGEIPVSERLGLATWPDAEHFTSGTFDVDISSPATDTRIKIGDWLMLSRYINSLNGFPVRERHKWYRVISVGNETTFPRQVRISGQPWDWTQIELAAGFGGPVLPITTVTMLKDVIQVYQRSITPQPF